MNGAPINEANEAFGRKAADWLMRFQKSSSRAFAAVRPSIRPEASSTALTAPALAPLTASRSTSASSSSRSSTPAVNAPNEPPPCSASESRRGGQTRAPPPRKVSTCSIIVIVRAFGLVADRDESDVALQQRHSDGERKRGRTISALDFAARPDLYPNTRRLMRARPTPQRQLPAPLRNFDG